MTPPKGYKHTELGILPQDWEVVRLGEVFDFVKTYSNSRSDLSESLKDIGGVDYIHYGDIHTKFKHFIDMDKDTLPSIDSTKLAENFEDITFVKNGDLVVADASEDYSDIGKSIEVKNLSNPTVSGLHTILCRDRANHFANGYKGYIFSLYSVHKQIKRLACGISVLGISKNNLAKVQIPLPPLAEQEKIAEILSTWDTQIQNYESLIKEKQTLKKGLCQTLLTAKTRLKGFSEDWEVVRLGEIVEDEDFKRIPISSVEREKLTKDSEIVYPYYGAMGQVGWINDYIFDEERILLAEDGCPFLEKDKQKSFIAKGKYWVNNHAHILKVDLSKGNNYFLCNQLNRVDYAKYINGAERLKLNKEVMKEIKIPIPSLAEQERIAEILGKGDREIMLLEQKLESLKSQKKGIMQNLLNGKVRIEYNKRIF